MRFILFRWWREDGTVSWRGNAGAFVVELTPEAIGMTTLLSISILCVFFH